MGLPQQVPRLAVVFAVAVVALVAARAALVPATFGKYGHYRAAAVDSIAARPVKYAGRQDCEECHDDVAAERLAGNHRGVGCEVCHRPQATHVAAPSDVTPPAPRDRSFCVRCQAYNASRPTGFPQIDPVMHNPLKPCIACHDPHAPVPPRVPQVLQIVIGTLVPLILLRVSSPALRRGGMARGSDELRRLIYLVTAVLVEIGIFSIRWNVVVGGQLFSKSLRGLTVYKVEVLGAEGVAITFGLLALPLVILWVLVKVLPPWPDVEARRA